MTSEDDSGRTALAGPFKVFVGGCGLTVVIIGSLMIAGRASTAKWERYAEKLRAGGEPLTFAELEARRTAVPEEENAARVVERLMIQADSLDPKSAPEGGRWVLVLGSATVEPFTAIPRHMLGPSRAFRDRHQTLLDELETMAEKSTGRYSIAYNERSPIVTLLPHIAPLRAFSKLVQLDGVLKLADGQLAQAAQVVELQFGLAATLHQEPTILSRLVQIAIEAQAVTLLELLLRCGELDRPALQRLGDAIDRRLELGNMKWALQGERAFWIETMDRMADGSLCAADLTPTVEGLSVSTMPAPTWLPKTLLRSNQLEGTRMYSTLVDAADDPRALAAATEALDTRLQALPRTQFLIRNFMPSLSRAATLDIRIKASLRSARTALAADSFRLRTGRWPTALDELVPGDLPSIPDDPLSDQPLRLTVNDRGLVIYSVGEDGLDEGGDVCSYRKAKRCKDTGFRLLSREHRGFPWVDDPPPPEEE